MLDEQKEPASAEQLLRNSLLFRQSQAQREEILKHKWYESEKVGHDIGMEWATIDWNLKHGRNWLRWWRQEEHRKGTGQRLSCTCAG